VRNQVELVAIVEMILEPKVFDMKWKRLTLFVVLLLPLLLVLSTIGGSNAGNARVVVIGSDFAIKVSCVITPSRIHASTLVVEQQCHPPC
jgi:hypothetical protein